MNIPLVCCCLMVFATIIVYMCFKVYYNVGANIIKCKETEERDRKGSPFTKPRNRND